MPNEPLAYVWDADHPLPRLVLRPSLRMQRQPIPAIPPGCETGRVGDPFDFCAAMRGLCVDIVQKCPPLAHVDPAQVLFTIIKARTSAKHGLQARVTPLRGPGGGLHVIEGKRTYHVQQYRVDGQEMLYLMTFCLPRFQNRTYAQKLVTVFHELYHLSEVFDGTTRSFGGRYATHTANQKEYDAHVAQLAEQYLRQRPDRRCLAFLQLSFWQLCRRHGTVVGVHVPRPRLIRVN